MLTQLLHYILIQLKNLITDELWGIYYKPDIEGLGVQGGTSPYIVDKHFDKVMLILTDLSLLSFKQQKTLMICGVQL